MDPKISNTDFWSDDRVRDTMTEARAIFGSTDTTEREYEGMMNCLSMAYIYCSDLLRESVYSTLQEAGVRKSWFLIRWAFAKAEKLGL